MFAGQGSQHYGMGRELFEQEPLFRQHLLEADAIFRDLVNESLLDILYRPRRDRFEPFRRLLHSSPAILSVECALARVLLARGLPPAALLGQSLGEISCLVVADVLSFEDALVLVIKKSALLEYCAPPGGMLAILDTPDLLSQFPAAFEQCEIAGWNFAHSFLVSGPSPALDRLRHFLRHRGTKVFDLPVAHAFHSHWTDLVATPLHTLLHGIAYSRPRFPIVSSAHGHQDQGSPAANLWQALRSRIDLPTAIRHLEASGPHHYLDLGPSGNLATAVKYNLAPHSTSTFSPILTPFGQDLRNLHRLLPTPARRH